MTDNCSPKATSQVVLIGVDWADQTHVICLIDPQGRTEHHELPQEPEAIFQWADQLHQRFPNLPILVALEQSHGALFHALVQIDHFQLFPINPKQLARFREALHPAGGKDDPTDAELLAQLLLQHRQHLRQWQPDDELTRRIGQLVRLRRKLVEQRKALAQRLRSTLKGYFPLIITLFGKQLTSTLVLDLLARWPSLTSLKRAHPRTLRAFLHHHGIRNAEQQTTLIQTLRSAVPLSRDQALIEPYAAYVKPLVEQLRILNNSIADFDQQLAQAVAQHDDAATFQSVPGAGAVLVPRLIAAFGSDRERYQSAEEVQTLSGIAPVTRRSGKSCQVRRRLACPVFLKQTFHELADQARKWSPWSRAFYQMKRDQGMKHHAALRALAFKWIRILFRLWKQRTTYSEARYIEHLRAKNSPIIKYLQTQ